MAMTCEAGMPSLKNLKPTPVSQDIIIIIMRLWSSQSTHGQRSVDVRYQEPCWGYLRSCPAGQPGKAASDRG